MATRKARKGINRATLAKVEIVVTIIFLLVFGFTIGILVAPTEAEEAIVTQTVETPVYDSSELPESPQVVYYDVPLSHSLQKYIYEVCADEKVPVSLIIAIIDYESNFNPETVSSTDDYGLMQINEVNHGELEEKYRCADMLDPYQNVFCGVKIIGQYLATYKDDYAKALMAYNMGDYGAKKAWEDGITSTSYSEGILKLMNEYEQEVQENAESSGNE